MYAALKHKHRRRQFACSSTQPTSLPSRCRNRNAPMHQDVEDIDATCAGLSGQEYCKKHIDAVPVSICFEGKTAEFVKDRHKIL